MADAHGRYARVPVSFASGGREEVEEVGEKKIVVCLSGNEYNSE